jgi:serine/threonine protein kinase
MLTQGEILRNRYRVIRQLGQGGMGAVYEAHDNVFDTSVALKEVMINLTSNYDTKAQEMAQLAFEREAKILARVNHENIPHVKDYFTEEDAQFLVMELVDGDDLGKLLMQRRSPFPVATIIEWTDRILDALEYLHSQNPPVIHRDIKPQNLKLTTRKKIKLLDFGIAKGTESTAANTVTNQTFIAATLNYSPVEQMLRVLDPTFLAVITHKYGEKIDALLDQNADARTDLFALGATMYHLITNVSPAEAVKRAIDVWDGKPDPLENPAKLNPEISKEFSDFILKSMEIRRENRFNSADEMRNALNEIIEVSTNPTLKQTVEMSYNEFQSKETAVFNEPVSQETAIFSGASSQETANFSGVDSQETANFGSVNSQENAFSNANTGNSGFNSPPTNELPPPNTGFNQSFDTNDRNFLTNQPPVKKKSKLIWLLPVAALFLLLLGGGAFGVWFMMNRTDQGKGNSNNSNNSNTVGTVNTNKNTNIKEDTTGQQGVGVPANTEEPDNSKTEISTTPVKTNPTPNQTTPRPTEIAKPNTPKPPPTKKPTPKPKNMDCIFTDDCE